VSINRCKFTTLLYAPDSELHPISLLFVSKQRGSVVAYMLDILLVEEYTEYAYKLTREGVNFLI